jgi:hypothetical protein
VLYLISHARLRVNRSPGFPCALYSLEGQRSLHHSGEIAPRECGFMSMPSLRGAKATKQSILSFRGVLDCFAEPVIGRAFARPVGSQ